MKRARWNSSLSYDVDKARAWQRRGKPLARGGRLNPFNRERRDRTRRDEHGHVVVYGPFHRWLDDFPCIVGRGCFGPVKGHHLRKASIHGDYGNETPLCVLHHTEIHHGKAKFERKYQVDTARSARELARLWDELRAA